MPRVKDRKDRKNRNLKDDIIKPWNKSMKFKFNGYGDLPQAIRQQITEKHIARSQVIQKTNESLHI